MQITIMQPTYLPWIGYFALMMQTKCFVFLDDVQFDSRSWQQRNKIKSPTGALMLTVPVLKKSKRQQLIREVLIQREEKWKKKHLASIRQFYAKSRYYNDINEHILSVYQQDFEQLADLNIAFIRSITGYLDIKINFVNSSSLQTEGSKTEKLIQICQSLEAEAYLSPPGSFEYIDEDEENLFLKNNIHLYYSDFTHPVYSQLHGGFISHLSVIDLLMNEGKNSAAIIQSGIHPPLTHEAMAQRKLNL